MSGKQIRISDKAKVLLDRLRKETGLSGPEILSRALDLAEGRCDRCGQKLGNSRD